MKAKYLLSLIVGFTFSFGVFNAKGESDIFRDSESLMNVGEYTVVIEGYDWGPAVSKVILRAGETVKTVNISDYTIQVERKSECGPVTNNASGARSIVYGYVSDLKGNKVAEGENITLVMSVGPDLRLGLPYQNFNTETCKGVKWLDYNITVTNTVSKKVWNKEVDRIIPLVDKFDVSGKFTSDTITMSYASYVPNSNDKKSPLIIWLHGGGEGGTDPLIPLLGNRAANYASDEIQYYFGGAYVLVPQCPERWMANGKGGSTSGAENDVYNKPLMALIKDYVASHPAIDVNRIYVAGCSNGGYMGVKLLLLYPDYFAAGLISSCSYRPQYLTDAQIASIKDIPIWFVQSADDRTTIPEETCLPFYKRLIAAGAKNVHLSFYDHVVDITGFYGGDNYYYAGHWSWVYLHANKSKYDFDGTPVKIDGRPVTIMEWTAAQSK